MQAPDSSSPALPQILWPSVGVENAEEEGEKSKKKKKEQRGEEEKRGWLGRFRGKGQI